MTTSPPTCKPDKVAEAPLDAALAYARLGWHVLPLYHITEAGVCSCSKGKDCGRSTAKHPRIKRWEKDVSADPVKVTAWWAKWPQANVGILTGAESNIFDLECEEEGIADLAALQEANEPLPKTPQAVSGNGGLHNVFRWPSGGLVVTTGSHLDKKPIDTRGRGGQFVVPPSRNKGGLYRWLVPPFEVEPAEAPEWLLAWLEEHGRLERPSATNGQANGSHFRVTALTLSLTSG
jgi:putative DNA primase/helicase